MLDFFASPPPEYQSAEVEKRTRELLERLALQKGARTERLSLAWGAVIGLHYCSESAGVPGTGWHSPHLPVFGCSIKTAPSSHTTTITPRSLALHTATGFLAIGSSFHAFR